MGQQIMLDSSVHEAIRAIAKKTGLSMANVVKRMTKEASPVQLLLAEFPNEPPFKHIKMILEIYDDNPVLYGDAIKLALKACYIQIQDNTAKMYAQSINGRVE